MIHQNLSVAGKSTFAHNPAARLSLPADIAKARLDGVALFLLALVYATLRYQVGKDVPWSDWPVYTVNKALGVAALGMVAAGLIRFCLQGVAGLSPHFALAGHAMVTHGVLSLVLLQPAYLPKFYAAQKLTVAASLALLLGAAAAVAFYASRKSSRHWLPQNRVRVAGTIAFAAGLHAALPGTGTWLAFGTWPFGLPPITLISFLIGTVAALFPWFFTRPTHLLCFEETVPQSY